MRLPTFNQIIAGVIITVISMVVYEKFVKGKI